MSKTRASCFIRGSKHLETIKALGLRPRAFICFSVFGTPDETLALVFDMTSQSRLKIQCNKACKNSRLKIQCNKACKNNVFPAGMVNSSCNPLPVYFESRLSHVSSVLLHSMVIAD